MLGSQQEIIFIFFCNFLGVISISVHLLQCGDELDSFELLLSEVLFFPKTLRKLFLVRDGIRGTHSFCYFDIFFFPIDFNLCEQSTFDFTVFTV